MNMDVSKPETVESVFQSPNNENPAAESISDHEQCSKSGNESFGLNELFDMGKIVDTVKVKIKERREKKNMQETVGQSYKKKNNRNEWKDEKKRENNSGKCSFENEKLDSDSSFGLTILFKAKKVVHKRRRSKKVQTIVKKMKDDGSYGLEMLFSEKNISDKKTKPKSRKRRMVKYDDYSEETPACEEEKMNEKVKKKRPNHFVAIRVSDPNILVAIKDFQDAILKESEKLKPALIPSTSLHITMAVMYLDGELVKIAQTALQKCRVKVMEALKEINYKLTFSGVGNFNNEVIFAKVQEKDQIECLETINRVITASFKEHGIFVNNDTREWKAHLTLLKLSRKRSLRKSGIKKVEEDLYASWKESYFGQQFVQSIHLCSMLGRKENDGFYECLSTIMFPSCEEKLSCV